MGRNSPTGRANVRVGNYRADVDTEGIDPEMQETMGIKKQMPKLSDAETQKQIKIKKGQNAALQKKRRGY